MKKETSHHSRRFLCCFLLFWGIVGIGFAQKQKDETTKTLLVINSYEENEPWANDISEPIGSYVSTIENITCDIVNLNNSFIQDSIAYDRRVDGLFKNYADNHPSYVVMVGNFAFNLRDRIKEEWGNIPILLITSIDKFAPREKHYTSNPTKASLSEDRLLREVRDDYNFTAIVAPEYHEETVDLMLKLQPDMKEFVFFSTNIYAQRHIAYAIEEHLARLNPDIKFRWVRANEENSAVIREYVTKRHPETGLLVAQWVFQRIGTTGESMITSSDLRLMISSKNPIYSIREPYRIYGIMGGVYDDSEEVHSYIRNVVDQMVDNGNMRRLPFIYAKKRKACINYRLMQEFNLQEKNCPEGTEFYGKPKSYWELYFWQNVVAGLLVLIVICALWLKTSNQHKKITRLNYSTLFLNNMPVPFAKANILFDKEGNITQITYASRNQAYQQLLDLNGKAEYAGMLFPPEFFNSKVAEMLNEKKNVVFSYRFEKTDTYFEFTLCSVLNKEEKYGKMNVVDIFALDLTNRFRMEENMRQFNNKLDIALSVSRTVPWQWNVESDVIFFDDRNLFQHIKSHRIPGTDFEEWEINFEDFFNRVYPDDRMKIMQMKMDVKLGTQDRIQNMQVRILTEGKRDFEWVEINSSVTKKSDNGKPCYIAGSMRIITEKVNADHMLLAALEKAKESDRMKSAFLANMSHEIRTPLNAIVGFSNLLCESSDPEEQKEFKDIINRNNDLMLSLVNDVLDLAKIESNTIDLQYSSTDVNATIQAALQTVRYRVQSGVTLTAHYGMESCITETDSIRLSQILINLLSNACKFTNQGAIEVGYDLKGDNLEFYVEDTGIGISAENKDVIFDRFVKLNSFVQGTGLGLAICSSLVDLMQGEIGVDSEGEGKGSRFWFRLPYKPCSLEEEESEESKIEDAVPESKNRMPVMMVAEDNMSNYMLVAHLLRNEYSLIRATNGLEAIQLFAHCHPDIILMDINMPIMDGYEATRRIREISKTVPIIAVTAYAYESDRKRILSSGFNAYVSKPINFKNIKDAISRSRGG